jgi:glycosyltransferase involved in cell wall biosynthesis
MTKIYFIDVKNVIADGGSDVVERHDFYARAFRLLPDESSSRVFIASRSCGKYKPSKLSTERICSKFYPSYLWKTLKSAHSSKPECITLIAGDPWLSGFTAIQLGYLFRLMKKCTRIQMQLHADICDPSWLKQTWLNAVKSKLGLFMLRFADSIRFVSESQMKLVAAQIDLTHKECFVSPINMSLMPERVIHQSNRPRVLGFVGRMEKERGTDLLVALVEKISNASSNDFKVRLVGDGSESKTLQERLIELLGKDSIHVTGHVSQTRLIQQWGQIGVLVNLAPAESYGRTMREAASSGIPVWAVRSNGFDELSSSFDLPWIKELSLDHSAIKLASEFDSLINISTSSAVRDQLIDKERQGLGLLVNSWKCKHAV